MTKIEPEEIEKLDEVETLDESDETIDWKEKAKGLVEKAIQRREKSKIFRQQYKDTMDELTKLKTNPPNAQPPKNEPKPDDALLQRMERLSFKQHGISHEDDIELARKTAKKWNMDVEEVLEDEDFKAKLEKQQTARTNVEATSNVRGSNSNQTSSKAKADYWIGKNTPPSDEYVATNKIPREELAKIMGHFVTNKGSNKKFYND